MWGAFWTLGAGIGLNWSLHPKGKMYQLITLLHPAEQVFEQFGESVPPTLVRQIKTANSNPSVWHGIDLVVHTSHVLEQFAVPLHVVTPFSQLMPVSHQN